MKSYTDLEQSKKLAEILPLESSDMWWSRCTITDFGDGVLKVSYAVEPCNISQFRNTREDVPCWSLAALLEIIPYAIHKSDNEFYRLGIDKGYNDYAVWYSNNGLTINDLDVTSDNFVDACVKMIIKLHEQKLL